VQTNTPNYFSPNQDGEEHNSKKAIKWIIIILVIVGIGFLIYKNYKPKEPTVEEKLDLMNSLLNTEENSIPKEEKQKMLDEQFGIQEQEQTPEEEKIKERNDLLQKTFN